MFPAPENKKQENTVSNSSQSPTDFKPSLGYISTNK